MPVARADRWPVLGRHERAVEWLLDLARRGRARGTVDAHARCLAEYLDVCEQVGVDPVSATGGDAARVASGLAARLTRMNGDSSGPGAGPVHAALLHRLASAKLFYDFLVARGLRDSNPVSQGHAPARADRGSIGTGPTGTCDTPLSDSPFCPSELAYTCLSCRAALGSKQSRGVEFRA